MGLAMIYMTLVIVLYPLGGAHLNPALTLGQLIATKSWNLIVFCCIVMIAQFIGGIFGMSISMLFRAFGTSTLATPGFASSVPIQNSMVAGVDARVSISVFTAEMFLTAVMIIAQLFARQNKVNVIYIAFPSAVALYFANAVVTMLCSGYNNPVVAMIICI